MNTPLTLSKYIEKILSLTDVHNDMKLFKALQFRGHGNSEHLIIPSIARRIEREKGETFLAYERELIQLAQNRHPEMFHAEMHPLNLLAQLQHHGIPTRLLDVTENPLVALYFACADRNSKDKDGEVIAFINHNASEINSSIDDAVADSYRIAYRIMGGFIYLDTFYERANSEPYFDRNRIERVATEVADGFDGFFEITFGKPRFVSTLQLSSRQKAQQGKYILFPNEFGYVFKTEDMPEQINFVERKADIPLESKKMQKVFLEAKSMNCLKILNILQT